MMHKARRRQITVATLVACLLIYVPTCLVLGVVLGRISLQMPRRIASNFADIHVRWKKNFGAVPHDVSVQATDGVTLRAWYAAPSAANGRSVVLLHGIGGDREDMSGFADMFLQQGYAVLVPDSRAHGESGGDVLTYGIQERFDVEDWVHWLRARQPGCTFLLGESMGAAIGLQAAAVTPQLCAVAVEDPYAHFRELAPERMAHATQTGTLLWQTLARPVIDVAILFVRFRHGVWLTAADPMRALQQSHVPALLITGTRDFEIPRHHAEELQRACRERCSLWVVKGAAHGGASRVAGTEFNRRILEWFAQHDTAPATVRS